MTCNKLGSLDNVSTKKNKKYNRAKSSACEYISFKDPDKSVIHEFKLYKEDELPNSLCKLKQAEIMQEEHKCDNDCLTDNEQIETSMKLINTDIKLVIKEYLNQKKKINLKEKTQK